MSDTLEMIDIYDDNRQLTGEKMPRKSRLTPGKYMLYVYALIQDNEGRYLVTRRAMDKKWAAGWWEVPGGGVSAGETSLDAIRREVLEETGLDIRDDDVSVLSSYKNVDNESGDNYFADIYLVKKAFTLSEVTAQKSEVTDVRLADFSEIKSLEEADGFLHYERISTALTQKG